MVTPAASATQRISRRGGSLFMNGKEMRPYLQGALDGLCAVYSIVNAARIISDTGEDDSKELFKHILAYLENREDLGRVLTEGIGLNTVGSILRDAACSRIHERNMPFNHRPETSLDEFWSEMMSFLDQGQPEGRSHRSGGAHVGPRVHRTRHQRPANLLLRYVQAQKPEKKPLHDNPADRGPPHLLCPMHAYFLS